MAAAIIGGGGGDGWTRLRGMGSGASGATVSLAVDDASCELFVVKSAVGAAARQQLRREWSVMSELSSPHVLKCLGFSAGEHHHQLFLEFAPGGSLADVAARNYGGGRLDEVDVSAYAADMVRGLDYLHANLVVHGDVKGSNVLVGADGRAKLADFGCSKQQSTTTVIGGTPAFMAPEVARGEEQGPAADVWALGCTVVEMATGHAPWGSGADNVLAALRMIGYTDGAVPEVPPWLSPAAKDFLNQCLQRRADDRATAAELLQHPFVSAASSCGVNNKEVVVKATWVSPTSALDAALWESESSSSSLTDDEEDDDLSSNSNSPIGRIRAMACSGKTLPDWDSDRHCWIQVLSSVSNINVANKTTETAADDESSECLAAKRVIRAMACSPSSVPADWDSDQGWIDVLGASPADDNEEFDVAAAADEIFGEAVGSIVVGVGSEQSVVAENQEDVFTSLSSCSERVLLVAVHAADNVAASRKAEKKQCSNFSY